MPKVSVIMGVYNGEKYLGEAIESILSQTFKDFEFIIVDDGSNDKTPEILIQYQKQDKRIKVLKNNQNTGLTKSLNKALKLAKGEYIARQDADDISLSERLERQVEFLGKNQEIGVIGCKIKVINSKGKTIKEVKFPKGDLKRYLKKRNFLVHGSLMIRKKILDLVGGYNESMKMAQDYELILRISKISGISYLKEFLYLLRRHKRALSYKKVFSQIKYTCLAKKKFFGWKGFWGNIMYVKDIIYTFFIIYKLGIPSFLRGVCEKP